MSNPPAIGAIKLALAVLVLGYTGFVLFALLFGNKLTFPAPPPGYADSPDIEKFPFGSSDKSVSMLYLPRPGSRFLIFYQHGNAEDLESILPRLETLRKAGFAVLAWDYPGYGTSDGKPAEDLILQISERIWKSIPERYGYREENTILYGRSLGGGPATSLAAHHQPAGLILESTFTSVYRVVTRIRLLPWDTFDNLAIIDRIRCPILFMHGTRDRTVPFWHSRKLLEKAPDPKFFAWYTDGSHNNLVESYPEIYYSSLGKFAEFLVQEEGKE